MALASAAMGGNQGHFPYAPHPIGMVRVGNLNDYGAGDGSGLGR